MIARRQVDLYYIEGIEQRSCAGSNLIKQQIDVWHERLDHLNNRDMNLSNYNVCIRAKFTNSPSRR